LEANRIGAGTGVLVFGSGFGVNFSDSAHLWCARSGVEESSDEQTVFF